MAPRTTAAGGRLHQRVHMRIKLLLLPVLLPLVQGFAAVPSPPSSHPPPPNFLRFKRLQNQFDFRGVALPPIDGGHDAKDAVTLSPVEAYFLGQAFATWLKLQHEEEDGEGGGVTVVAVGRDSRLTGPALSRAVLDGIEAVCPGAALDLGLCSTPAAFHACLPPPLGLSARGSVEVTASHLPPDRNGLKLFARGAGRDADPDGLREEEVGQLVVLATKLCNDQRGVYPNLDLPTDRPHPSWRARHDFLPDVYGLQHLAGLIRDGDGPDCQPLRGMKVVVNGGHGAGGFFVPVLAACGAGTQGSFYLEPDGAFPGCNPNPEDAGNMLATVAAVAEHGADLGIVLDPDCDRLGLVEGGSSEPTPLNRNRLIAMAAAVVLREHPGTTIVTDSVTSEGLRRFIERRGGRHLRFKKGYRNVIAEAQALNARGVDCQLAMECSGHAAFKENRFLDDGPYLAVKLLRELAAQRAKGEGAAGRLSDLIKDLEEPHEYAEIRLKVLPGHDRAQATERVLQAFAWVTSVNSLWQMEKENWEGLRARVQEGGGRVGWLHFRPSLHDPVVSLTCESETAGGVAAMVRTLLDGGVEEATAEAGVDWAEAHRYVHRAASR